MPAARLPITAMLLLLACPLASGQQPNAQEPFHDRAPELKRMVDELAVEFRTTFAQQPDVHRQRYEQLAEAIRRWNASPRSDAQFARMAGWLRAALLASQPGAGVPLPTLPEFESRELLEMPADTVLAGSPAAAEAAPVSVVARKPAVVEVPLAESQPLLVNLVELRARVLGHNRRLREIESQLMMGRELSAAQLARLAQAVSDLAEQRAFAQLYLELVPEPRQEALPELRSGALAAEMLQGRVVAERHALRRRRSPTAENEMQEKLRLLEEASHRLGTIAEE